MPNNFVKNIIKNTNDQIKYKETIILGEIKVDNGDGTYGVEINQSGKTYPNVETAHYGDTFTVGEIAIITYEYGNKEMPRIWGHAKKIAQNPVQVEVNYSGGCSGVQTKTVTINEIAGKNGVINVFDSDYSKLNISVDCSDLEETWLFFADAIKYIAVATSEVGGGVIGYEIIRAYIYFDCSSIPMNAKITKVILSLYGDRVRMDEGDFNMVIQNGQPNYPHNLLVLSDYDRSKYSNNGGQIAASAISIGAYNNITLNSNGRNWINKGGITKFCLRSSMDIATTTPGKYNTNVIIFESGVETNICKLVITYEI